MKSATTRFGSVLMVVASMACTPTHAAEAGLVYPSRPFAEAGYPRYDMSIWYGIFAPARMPASIVTRLNADVNGVMQQPEVAEKFAAAGFDPAGGWSPAQFADYSAAEVVKWNDAAKVAGIR